MMDGLTPSEIAKDMGLEKKEVLALRRTAIRDAFGEGLIRNELLKSRSWERYERLIDKAEEALDRSLEESSKNYPVGDPRFWTAIAKLQEQQDRLAGIHMGKETVQRAQGEETDYREVIRERILTIRRKYSREQVAARAAATDAAFTEQEQNGDEQAAQGEEAGRNVDAGRQPGSAPSPTAGGHVAASGGAAGAEGAVGEGEQS